MSNSGDEGGEVPLLICSRKTEFVVSPIVMHRWSKFLKKGFRLWECQEGRHFFHDFYPESAKNTKFWAISTQPPSKFLFLILGRDGYSLFNLYRNFL